MLRVILNQPQFEYDIHSLVKAFFPEEEVKVAAGEDESQADYRLFYLEDELRFADASGRQWRRPAEVSFATRASRDGVKNQVKLLIYGALSEVTGRELPWGTLTGIRPTKIAVSMLEQRRTDEEIRAHMREAYRTSAVKQELAIEIAHRERRVLSTLRGADSYSLYVGIPFCPTTCMYCSFPSYAIAAWKDRVEEYLAALEREIDFVAESRRGSVPDTVYIGGGTPSTLTAAQLERLLGKLASALAPDGVREFTVEAGRADSITAEKLEVMKRHGVSRISINPQTMNQATLDRIGRRHTVGQVLEAFRLARECGFDHINMDIILGLPGETPEDVAHTLDMIGRLRPESLTVHSLAVKRGSKLADYIRENGMEKLRGAGGGVEAVMAASVALAERAARGMGLVPYYLYRQKNMFGNFENVGYAMEGRFGLYNILIMEEVQTIIALGAGAISKRVYEDGRIKRCENVKEVAQYIERIDEMIERKRVLFEEA